MNNTELTLDQLSKVSGGKGIVFPGYLTVYKALDLVEEAWDWFVDSDTSGPYGSQKDNESETDEVKVPDTCTCEK